MSRLNEITLGDVGRGLRRYQPFLAVVVAILLIVVLLPGDDDDSNEAAEVAAEGQGPVVGGQGGGGGGRNGGGAGGSGGGAGEAAGNDASSDLGGGTSGGGGGGAEGGPDVSAPGNAVPQVPAGVGADCDRATGRIRLPFRAAPPCAVFRGNNGGSTYQGVTGKEITVVYYQAESNPAVDAALIAAGANNTREEQRATTRDYVDLFNKHYQLYGRRVKLVIKEGSGASDDDAVGKADAIDIATRIKPFAVFGSNNNAFMDELVARRILCVCSVSQPQDFYEKRSPYVGYTTLMASTQGYIHRAEYIGKRLHNRNAKWAGTSDGLPMNTKKRTFGLLYFETADKAYKSGVDFFERELKKYGVSLKVRLAYTGPPNLAATQEQSRPYIQRLKQGGVTSVVFSGDPISPAIFTQEATRQLYFPEWIITGSALTDTTIFGRTYDQQQWRRAFGISFLSVRFPNAQSDAYRVHVWHHGRPPTADNQYAVLLAPVFTTFTGIHMAGPNLTPQTFQQGLFKYPVTGRGMVTSPTSSWGRHGIWPFTDYTQFDDVTEIWWDPTARGEDEVGNQGVGMYQYVDGGKRYLPGQHPRTEPKAFNPSGAVSFLSQRPANERPPEYPRPKR